MDDARHYFKLGLFVVATTAMLAFAVVALGAHLFTHAETVPVETVVEESVAGLEVGSAVKYRGVTIGQVSRVSFADVKYASATRQGVAEPQAILVEMSLDPQKFKPMTVEQLRRMLSAMIARGLRARLSQSLLSGVTVVEINYVDPQSYPPPKLAWTPRGLYIPSAPSPISQVTGGVERLVNQLQAADLGGLVRRIDGLVGDVDKGVQDLHVAALRERAVALLDEVRGSNRHLDELLASPDVKRAVADLPRITGDVQKSAARIDQILHDKRIEQLMTGLAGAASDAGPAAGEARRLLQELRELVASQNENVRIIVENVRSLTEDGRGTMAELKQNPARLILGAPPPRTEPGAHP